MYSVLSSVHCTVYNVQIKSDHRLLGGLTRLVLDEPLNLARTIPRSSAGVTDRKQGKKEPVAEFKEFERRFKFKPRFKYGWFHFKLYQMYQDFSRRLI